MRKESNSISSGDEGAGIKAVQLDSVVPIVSEMLSDHIREEAKEIPIVLKNINHGLAENNSSFELKVQMKKNLITMWEAAYSLNSKALENILLDNDNFIQNVITQILNEEENYQNNWWEAFVQNKQNREENYLEKDENVPSSPKEFKISEKMVLLSGKLKDYNGALMATILQAILEFEHTDKTKVGIILNEGYNVNVSEYHLKLSVKKGWYDIFEQIFQREKYTIDIILKYLKYDEVPLSCTPYVENQIVEQEKLKDEFMDEYLKDKTRMNKEFLKALINNNIQITIEKFSLQLASLADHEILIDALELNRDTFLNYAFNNRWFSSFHLQQSSLRNKFKELLKRKDRYFIVLKVLAIADFDKFSSEYTQEIFRILERQINESFEDNILICCHNACLAIALCAEILIKIGISKPMHQKVCNDLSDSYVKLGGKVVEKITDYNLVKELYLEEDYQERNLIHIVTKYEMKELFLAKKIEYLITTIWFGDEFNKCNGSWSDFSYLTRLGWYSTKVTNHTLIPTLLLKEEKQAFEDEDHFTTAKRKTYIFQYVPRRHFTTFLYGEDLFFSFLFVVFFQLVNFLYIDMFSSNNLEDMPRKEQEAEVDRRLALYKEYTYISMGLVLVLLCQLIQKIIYNMVSTRKLPIDKWSVLDALTIITNLVAIYTIQNVTNEQILSTEKSYTLDFYIISVVIIAWARFFFMFLLISILSPLLHMLYNMISQTIAFLTIMCCYLLIAASVFFTLYVDVKPSEFGTFPLTIRSLLCAMLDYPDLTGFQSREQSFSILIHIHIFIAAVLLLNFLIAILSSVYEMTKQDGDFSYRSNVYQYSEKYRIPLEDPVYGELVYHPVPVSLVGLALLPFMCKKECALKVARSLGLLIFWSENFFLIILFLIYSLLILFFIYFKQIYTLFVAPIVLKKKVLGILTWIIIGFPILIITAFLDTYRFTVLFCFHIETTTNEEEINKKQEEVKFYNEIYKQMREIIYDVITFKESHKLRKGTKCHIHITSYFIIEQWLKVQNQKKEMARSTIIHLLVREIGSRVKKLEDQAQLKLQRGISTIKLGSKKDTRESKKNINYDEETTKKATDFVRRFTVLSLDQKEHLNAEYIYHCLPLEITMNNLYQMKAYNFQLVQKAIVGFQNEDQSQLFDHYDLRNISRNTVIKTRMKELFSKVEDLQSMKDDITYIKNNLMGNQELSSGNITDQTVKVTIGDD